MENKEYKLKELKLKAKKVAILGGIATMGVGLLSGCSKNKSEDLSSKSNIVATTEEAETSYGDISPDAESYMKSILDYYNSKSNSNPITMDELGIVKLNETPYIYKSENGSYSSNPTVTSANFIDVENTEDMYTIIDTTTNRPISSLCKIHDDNDTSQYYKTENIVVECFVTNDNEIVLYNPSSYYNITDNYDQVYSYFEEYYNMRLNNINKDGSFVKK